MKDWRFFNGKKKERSFVFVEQSLFLYLYEKKTLQLYADLTRLQTKKTLWCLQKESAFFINVFCDSLNPLSVDNGMDKLAKKHRAAAVFG